MLVSTPTKPFTHRTSPCGSSMSPKYHHNRNHFSPKSKGSAQYDSPSPLRNRPLFPLSTNIPDSDDMLQSPYSPSHLAPQSNPFLTTKPQAIPADDEEGHIFLATTPSIGKPLLTPVKKLRRVSSRSALLFRHPSTAVPVITGDDNTAVSRTVGAGTKRKSSANTTPLRTHCTTTPLKLTQPNKDAGSGLHRLAPLTAPKFVADTPKTKAETEAYLRRHTDTLTRLRLSDPDGIDFNSPADDSGCEMDEDAGHALSPTKPKPPKRLVIEAMQAGKGDEEVIEAISPGGHVTKRRARSRPVSVELLEFTFKSPKKSPVKPIKNSGIPCRVGGTRPRHSGPVAFPSLSHRNHGPPASLSSSSEAGSPRPRRRISSGTRPTPLPLFPRAPLSRIESSSSATLFFGPSIPQPPASVPRSRTNTHLSSSTPAPALRNLNDRPLSNRHSYAGPPSSSMGWDMFQMRNVSPSLGSSPDKSSRNTSLDMEDEEMFFAGEQPSFVLNVINNTPSPPSNVALPKKFKPRDSFTINDGDELPSGGSGDFLSAMPPDSHSVSSFSDDGLVTPVCIPDAASGWPTICVTSSEEHPESSMDVDEFIQKTLVDASKASGMPKKAPGTPVKKARIGYFGHERPWQSAVASKVGLKDDCEFKKMPRKSLPAVFPSMGASATRAPRVSTDWQPTDTEDEEENSPSTRRARYTGLGLGQPTTQIISGRPGVSSIIRSRWPTLMRRSSSGAFSSGSESASNTPTRANGTDWQLPKPRIPLRLSPSSDALGKTSRSTSGSSSSSLISSPTTSRVVTPNSNNTAGVRQPRLPRPSFVNTRRLSDVYTEEEDPGRFEHDFDEIEEIGSGEFGKVMRVRSKNGDDGDVYAVKKSKRFEGAKHRLRLREEVDVLKHLSIAALSQSYANGRHPNVLGYVDSWEEDEALYIRTELCESGNLARFLWEYGRVFPHLDEARVWKVIADLSNGLRFIHDAGVIHLDLKPSNVFVTKEGRFKIGDFGMASLWPRPPSRNIHGGDEERGPPASECGTPTLLPARGCHAGTTRSIMSVAFEREGDKLYLAPEVLQGRYGKSADVFSLGMTILETASNIVVPDQGESWHRLRNEDFSQVDLDHHSHVLVDLIRQMMRTNPDERLTSAEVSLYPAVQQARNWMERLEKELYEQGQSVWSASPLASVPAEFLREILGEELMDTSA